MTVVWESAACSSPPHYRTTLAPRRAGVNQSHANIRVEAKHAWGILQLPGGILQLLVRYKVDFVTAKSNAFPSLHFLCSLSHTLLPRKVHDAFVVWDASCRFHATAATAAADTIVTSSLLSPFQAAPVLSSRIYARGGESWAGVRKNGPPHGRGLQVRHRHWHWLCGHWHTLPRRC